VATTRVATIRAANSDIMGIQMYWVYPSRS